MLKIKNYLRLIRIHQWVKNSFVAAPLFFSLNFFNLDQISNSLIAIICFCLASSIVYIFNDINDIEEDKHHPKKSKRPLASGAIKVKSAYLTSIIFMICLIALLLLLDYKVGIVIGTYFLLQLFYTKKLKHIAIFDVLIISSGFVLRVLVGGFAINVDVSPWIILTTYLLALFLGFGKRYHELSIEGYSKTRNSLNNYNKPFLDRLIGISCVSALVTYSIYTVETARLLNKTELVYSVIFVIFGLFRYLQILYVSNKGGEPERILFKDKLFLANCVIWFLSTITILLF